MDYWWNVTDSVRNLPYSQRFHHTSHVDWPEITASQDDTPRSSMSTPNSVLFIPAYRKHQHKEYTYKTVRIVYTASKLTAYVYCSYNSWHSSQRSIDCTLSSTVTITYVNIVICWFYWVYNPNDCCNFSKVGG